MVCALAGTCEEINDMRRYTPVANMMQRVDLMKVDSVFMDYRIL